MIKDLINLPVAALRDLDWRLIIPQPIVTTMGFIIDNYSKMLGASVLILQIVFLLLCIKEKLHARTN